MQDVSPQAPEERRRKIAAGVRGHVDRQLSRLGPGTRVYEVVKRTVVGVYSDGFIHAGNLAFLTLVTLFPFFIVVAALVGVFGQDRATLATLAGFLQTLPPSVRDVVATPIAEVLNARSGWLLWLSVAVGFWTIGGFIETIRDILRRAYGTGFTAPFWRYRLASTGLIVAAVFAVLLAFFAQVVLTAAQEFVYNLLPFAERALAVINLSRWVPVVVLFAALYALFYALTPSRYRYSAAPKWPGALFTALWWQLTVYALPFLLYGLENYDLTYGSLAGVIIALFFFWFVGLGLVFGAHLNAALAEPAAKALEDGA